MAVPRTTMSGVLKRRGMDMMHMKAIATILHVSNNYVIPLFIGTSPRSQWPSDLRRWRATPA